MMKRKLIWAGVVVGLPALFMALRKGWWSKA
jgi:hypothetical protein